MRVVGLLLFLGAAAVHAEQNATAANSTNNGYLSRKREQFRVLFEWNVFNYTWPSEAAYNISLANRTFVPENVLLSGIKHYKDRLYVTLPRMKEGVPATMAWIPATPLDNDTSPLLTPFPSWELNTVGDCRGFQSVQSFEIDPDGLMWVIDNGRAATLNGSGSPLLCPPSLSLIDLSKDEPTTLRYYFPESVANSSCYLNDIVVDDTAGGFAYITDNSRVDPGIIVFDKKNNKSWKFRDSNSMRAAKNAIHFSVGGQEFNTSINIDGIALGPRYINSLGKSERNVFFSPLSSLKLYGTPSSVLRNETFSKMSESYRMKLIAKLGEKPSQTDGMIMDEEGYLYFGLVGDHAIAQWDHRLSFTHNIEIISKDKNYIQWVDRFAFDNAGGLYVVINRLHNFIANTVKPEEVNYRILKTHVGTRSYMYSPKLAIRRPASVTRGGAESMSPSAFLTIWAIVCVNLFLY